MNVSRFLPDTIPAGHAFAHALHGVGGRPPYAWSLVSGTLPAGLVLSESGIISGKPLTPGHGAFRLDVRDSDHNHAAADMELRVSDGLRLEDGQVD